MIRRAAILALGMSLLLARPFPAEAAGARAKFLPSYALAATQTTVQPSGCNFVEETITWYNVFNWRLFSLSLRARYCWERMASGRWRLTQALITPKVWTAWWADYSFEGYVTDQAWGGVGQKEAGRYLQGRFRTCFPVKPFFCVERLPWVQIRVFARGGWEQASGG